jgi:hypothetical protein
MKPLSTKPIPAAEAVENPTTRVLEQRIRRALKHQGQALHRTRGERQQIDLGDYFIVDTQRNIIMQHHCDLEALGRDLEVFV